MGVEEVLGHIPAAVVVVEAGSRRIVYANPRARQKTAQLGRSIPLDLAEDWEIFHHDGRPYDVDEWPLVRSLATGEEVVDEEYFNLRADRSRLFVRASSAPIFGEAGAIVGGVLVMTDLTEQKAEPERLTYLAGLLDNTEDAIVALDAEWFVTVWNPGAERLDGGRGAGSSHAGGRSPGDELRGTERSPTDSVSASAPSATTSHASSTSSASTRNSKPFSSPSATDSSTSHEGHAPAPLFTAALA